MGLLLRLELKIHSKYSTVWYCLMLWFPYYKSNFNKRLVLEKREHFVLFSPKWIANFLSSKHSQGLKHSFIIKNRSGRGIDSWRRSKFEIPVSEKALFTDTTNFVFDRYDSKHLITGILKSKDTIFSRRILWSSVSNTF